MMRAKIKENKLIAWPYTPDQILADYPNVSFPAVLADLDLSAFDAVEVKQRPMPPTKWNENAFASEPQLIGGEWVVLWSVEVMSEAKERAKIDASWVNVRERRNAKLVACDWTQVADAPVDAAAWAIYRQALRDITDQPNPFELAWPIEPK
jgi:hypothetical protein